MNRKKQHRQVWVKTNTMVDTGIAPMVTLLSSIPTLITIDSCEGRGEWAYIYFSFGDYRTICKFLFKTLAPKLVNLYGEDITFSTEIINNLNPVGKISFRKGLTDRVFKTLRVQINAYRRYAFGHGSYDKVFDN